jgi:hypothetical protein
MHRETLAPAGDRHVEGGLDLADVFVDRAAQVGEAQVVDRMQGDFYRFHRPHAARAAAVGEVGGRIGPAISLG